MRLIKKIVVPVGTIALAIGLTACGAAQTASDTLDKGQAGASQAGEAVDKIEQGINAIPTSPADILNKIPATLQTETVTFVNGKNSCSISNNVAIKIGSITNWPNGDYTSAVTYSATKDGKYEPTTSVYSPLKAGADAHPTKTWSWPCVTAQGEDKIGWYKLVIGHWDANGKPDRATKPTLFQVTK